MSDIKEIKTNININLIAEEIKNIELGGDNKDQICIQNVKGINDPFYGIGQYGTDIDSSKRKQFYKNNSLEFIIPGFDIPYTNSIMSELKMYHTRIMKLKPKSCYSYHRDELDRIHIPIITNENCWFMIDMELYNLPANGNYYFTKTTKMHTYINSSHEDRIHLVGHSAL